ncbi:TetR/AcrR family transcriptional regulator [Lysinibacillus sp. BW-2-10]|uniref:TetR/AcrR family transcriptional regulator n=1 Tax=Lysinibacillus sp. BW-2-10 TaxID=2590030 RepID=UPI00117C18ED|nr:TetR/AcrR family transcriptional regulator [Lysinibacillus sp. BW-2-10]TSI08701.1 TetR/AcrR family transcriptional regulator [Lysinibacillus sp. BW-2-10]
MDTKSRIIEVATNLFQKKGYIGVGLNEILKECNISKGSLYHHFPNGKEELLITCLQSLNEAVTEDIEGIYHRYATTKEATNVMVEQLIEKFEREGTLTGYTFSSIVSEMAALSDPVREACAELYKKMQDIYYHKLVADGLSNDKAYAYALMMTASIEGAMMLCLTQNSAEPLKVLLKMLPNLIEK